MFIYSKLSPSTEGTLNFKSCIVINIIYISQNAINYVALLKKLWRHGLDGPITIRSVTLYQKTLHQCDSTVIRLTYQYKRITIFYYIYYIL